MTMDSPIVSLQLPNLPEFIQHRLDIFDKIKARQNEEIAGTLLSRLNIRYELYN